MLAGLEPVQDGYDNERGDQGDRAESDDKLSDEEEEITQAVPPLPTSFGKGIPHSS